MRKYWFKITTMVTLVSLPLFAYAGPHCNKTKQVSGIETLLTPEHSPFAIGHRGFGDNLGENPNLPIENTVEAVKAAFDAGIKIVEVDVSITADKKAVVLHDDFLADYTCINSLTLDELKSINPNIPTLEQVLRTTKRYARKQPLSTTSPQGLAIVEVKTPSPLCDPTDQTEFELIKAVTNAIHKTRTQKQVIIESFSPAILKIARSIAPDIQQNLTMSAVQFLSQGQVEGATGLPVTAIDKNVGLGLQWAEIGLFYRLPGYVSIEQYILTAHLLGVKVVALDQVYLAQAEQIIPGSAAAIVAQLQMMGITVTGYTVDQDEQWLFLESLGVDGIFTNDIPRGVSLQKRL